MTVIYAGSSDEKFYAWNGDGSVKWTQSSGSAYRDCIAYNGTVYSGNYNGNMYALDAETGSIEWTFGTSGIEQQQCPCVTDDTLYFGDNSGVVYALATSDGSKKWQYTVSNASSTSFYEAFHIRSDSVYCPGDSGNYFTVLNRSDGSLKWEKNFSEAVSGTPLTISDGVIFGVDDTGYYLYDYQGNEQWFVSTGDWTSDFTYSYQAPCIRNGNMFVSATNFTDTEIYSVDLSNGSKNWSKLITGASAYYPLLDPNRDLLYAPAYEGPIYALNISDGSINWTLSDSNWSGGTKSTLYNDILYIGVGPAAGISGNNIAAVDVSVPEFSWLSAATENNAQLPTVVENTSGSSVGETKNQALKGHLDLPSVKPINVGSPGTDDEIWVSEIIKADLGNPALLLNEDYKGDL